MEQEEFEALLRQLQPEGLPDAEFGSLLSQFEGGSQTNPGAVDDLRNRIRGMITQADTGVGEGLAGLAGLPMDIAAGATNAMFGAGNPVYDTSIDPETGRPTMEQVGERSEVVPFDPILGSQWLADHLVGDRPDPQTPTENFFRNLGQEVGAGAIPSVRAAQLASRPGRALLMEGLSGFGAASGATVAQEMDFGPNAELVATILGAGAPFGASRTMQPEGTGPLQMSLEDVRTVRDDAYSAADASTATLPEALRDQLVAAIRGQMPAQAFDDVLNPRAARVAENYVDGLPSQPTVGDVESLRRLIGENVAGSSDRAERSIGVGMRQALDTSMADFAEQTGGPLQQALESVQEGRGAAGRVYNAEEILRREDRAIDRAATSGTGGNEVNAIRQNIRGILDSPSTSRGYSEEELAAMREIVRGTPGENALRWLGRFSPSSGMMPGMFSAGLVGAGATQGPLETGLAILPGAVGYTAQGAAERMTRNRVEDLVQLVLNGAPIDTRRLSADDRIALQAALAGRLGAENAPETPTQ